MKENLNEILRQFGFATSAETEHLRTLNNSTWSVDGAYILKQNSDKSQVEKSVIMNNFLRGEGIPVVEYLAADTGDDFIAFEDYFYTVMRKMKGEHVGAFSGDFIDRAYHAGVEIARLHKALKKFSGFAEDYNSDLIHDLKNWVSQEIESKNIDVPREIMDSCLDFAEVYYALPRQLIHRDIQYGNILFDNNRLSGFLDFDLSQKNARIFDVVYFLNAILADNNFNDSDSVKQWRQLADSFLQGYHSENKLCAAEINAFHKMALSIQLIFIAWFASNQTDLIAQNIEMAKWIFSNKDIYEFTVKGI
ncbi:MAG: phosphotransferase [Defluviitaleaceae bacterium]|nr:phosphotransferase [Defluviitaleaceae bacterium]